MLMISEVAEATEEVRAGNPPVYVRNEDGSIAAIETLSPESFIRVNGYVKTPIKPLGEAIELADFLIRMADTFEHKGWDFNESVNLIDPTSEILHINDLCKEVHNPEVYQYGSALEVHFDLVRDAIEEECTRLSFARCFLSVGDYFQSKGWDLEKTIEVKMTYNDTREKRHGGKLY